MSTAADGSLRRFAPQFWAAATIWMGWGLGIQTIAGERASGGSYTLVGGPVAGGGVISGGGLTVDTAAGDFAPGVFRGGAFELMGTLYGVVTVAVGDVTLSIRDVGNGLLRIEWPASAVGYVLESAPVLGEPTRWQPVVPGPVGNSHTIATPKIGHQLYRLRKP